jgi:hypothetical protein
MGLFSGFLVDSREAPRKRQSERTSFTVRKPNLIS